MTSIPKDPYADELLLNVQVSKSGLIIKRDAYADNLLNYKPDETNLPEFPVDVEVPKSELNDNKKEKT